jgi:hypothetical protein
MCLHAACERASRARSHAAVCVWRRRLLLHSHRRELQGARPRLACRRPRRPRHRDCCARHVLHCSVLLTCAVRPCAMVLTGCGLMLHRRCYWQLGGRLESGKSQSGLLPQFQQQLRALLFCLFWHDVVCCARVCRTVMCNFKKMHVWSVCGIQSLPTSLK